MTGLLLLLASIGAAEDESYFWPLELPRQITSSFGEYRRGRLHAAIDLRTGPIGKSVHAARDGEVTRVRCSPWGYGKAVYIRFDDGNTAVYAHLNAFDEPIASYVRAAQHSRKSYTVDLYPGSGELPVRRGQRIAFSGQTGVGVPHLHYEIRNTANHPIDPRLVGIDWPDTARPVIRQVVVVPRSPDDRVNGDVLPLILNARAVGDGTYETDPVRVFGDVGFGVDVIDPANEGATKLGIHELRVITGDVETFRVRHELISYDTMGGGAVAYHPHLLNKGRFLLGWTWPGNRLESYRGNRNEGWVSPGIDPEAVTLEVEDFHGNEARVRIPLVSDAPEAEMPRDGIESAGVADIDLDVMGEMLVVTVDFPQADGALPTLEVEGVPAESGGRFFRVSSGKFRAGYVPAENGRVLLRVVHPRVSGWERTVEVFKPGHGARTVRFDDVRLDVPADAGYGTLFLRAYALDESPAPRPATPHGKSYMVWPSDAPLQKDIAVTVPMPEGLSSARGAHVYRLNGSYWGAIDTTAARGGLSVSASRLGAFGVLVDSHMPQISDVSPSEGAVLTSSRPRVRAKVSDQGSGIAGVTVTFGGDWLLCGWDPETGWVEWEQDNNLKSGEHELVITLTDRAGNTTVNRRTLTAP